MREVSREEFRNPFGSGLCITYRAPREAPRPLGLVPITPLEERLELARGVGPKVRESLAAQGFRTLAQLARHPRYGASAGRAFTALAKRDIPALIGAGARDVELARLFPRSEYAVIDIETAGLWQVLPLFLVGVALDTGDGWETRQFFARSFEEEGAVLHQAVEEIGGRTVCITYNGKAFDEPFVRARMSTWGVRPLKFRLHVDLLHSCRKAFGGALPDCRLGTVARHTLGMTRDDDVPGSAVPDLYYQFVRDGNIEIMEPILRHNALDLAALCRLLDAEALGLAASSDSAGVPEGLDFEKGAG